MPTADMHGGTVEFKDRDGRPVGFELVRIGTLKEFETVKAALENAQDDAKPCQVSLVTAKHKNVELARELVTADDSYRDLKERFNELAKDHIARGGDLESARSELDQEQERRKDGDHDLEMARAEIEDLMTVKASLEETNTALEVSQKELCESRAEFAASERAHLATGKECGNACNEREKSNAMLAAIKAELLTEGNRFKTILDALAEKIAGE
ncbi:MAG: hypothetical protein QGD90_00950 [Candidatus Hydrogenedentes bacterium]|nr:hypothetical protein [Candidatus Hydrogenedentota bacterium]